MLPLSIVLLVIGFVVAGFAATGSLGAGAMLFAAGFLLMAVLGLAHFLRGRTPTVF